MPSSEPLNVYWCEGRLAAWNETQPTTLPGLWWRTGWIAADTVEHDPNAPKFELATCVSPTGVRYSCIRNAPRDNQLWHEVNYSLDGANRLMSLNLNDVPSIQTQRIIWEELGTTQLHTINGVGTHYSTNFADDDFAYTSVP